MHWFIRFALWLAIAATILVFASWTAKTDLTIRAVVAVAFMIWCTLPVLYVIRAIYRFVVSR